MNCVFRLEKLSEVERIAVSSTKDDEVEVGSKLPATWRRRQQTGSTKDSHDWLARLKKYRANPVGLMIMIGGESGTKEWLELTMFEGKHVAPERVEECLESMRKIQTEGQVSRSFGFDPGESRHHFVVSIPRGAQQPIEISEHFTWSERTGSSPLTYEGEADGQIRVALVRPKWDAIADEPRAAFNARLKKMGRRIGSWKVGRNLVRRELGKELVLLAWAIEEADPGLISNAVANWKGLVPEERWWLYTQTAAATGHGLLDRGEGFGSSLVRQILFAVHQITRSEEVAPGRNWLRTELPNYWNVREKIVHVLVFLATFDQTAAMKHWRKDAGSARLLAGAVRNDHV